MALADERERIELEALMSGADVAEVLVAIVRRPAWMLDAACLEHPELSWFPGPREPDQAARDVCRDCLVRVECAAYASSVPGGIEGIWGGRSAAQRTKVGRQRLPAQCGVNGAVTGCRCDACRGVRSERVRRYRARGTATR